MNQILEQLGYSRSQSIVYFTLLNLGQITAGPIANKSKLDRVTVYKALDRLIKDGLVSYTVRANRKSFKAAFPTQIMEIIKERKEKLRIFEKSLPSLIEEYKNKKENIQTDIYEGMKGVKTLLEKIFKEAKKDDTWLVLGSPKSGESFGGYYKDLNDRIDKKGMKLKIIYNKDAEVLYNVRKTQPHALIRLMPENYITPTEITILNDNVAIYLYQPITVLFHIKCKEVADSFRLYFDLIWNNSEELKS